MYLFAVLRGRLLTLLPKKSCQKLPQIIQKHFIEREFDSFLLIKSCHLCICIAHQVCALSIHVCVGTFLGFLVLKRAQRHVFVQLCSLRSSQKRFSSALVKTGWRA